MISLLAKTLYTQYPKAFAYIPRKFLFTTTAIIAFGAVSITARLIRLIAKSFQHHQQYYTIPAEVVPIELQLEILSHALHDASDQDVLNLMLVCQEWSYLLNHHLKYEWKSKFISLRRSSFHLPTYRSQIGRVTKKASEIWSRHAKNPFWTPKMLYFLSKKRPQNPYHSSLSIDIPNTAKVPWYLPWRRISVLKDPLQVFHYLHCVLFTPEWFNFFTVKQLDLKQGLQLDLSELKHLSGLITLSSLLLNVPLLDVLFSGEFGAQLSWSNLWDPVKPWSTPYQIIATCQLLAFQLFELSTSYHWLLPVRVGVLGLFCMFSKGAKFFLQQSAVTGAMYLIAYLTKRRCNNKPNDMTTVNYEMISSMDLLVLVMAGSLSVAYPPIIFTVLGFSLIALFTKSLRGVLGRSPKESAVSFRFSFIFGCIVHACSLLCWL
jgi:hypothetical protein